MKITVIFFTTFFLFACKTTHEDEINLHKAIDKQVITLFASVKDWKNKKTIIHQTLQKLDSLLPNVRVTEDSDLFSFAFTGDSLAYLNKIIQHLDTTSIKATSYKTARFWLDTTENGYQLLEYTAYPNPSQKAAYTLEVHQKQQE